MKTAEQWSKDMEGETSPQMVKQIQDDALAQAAATIINEHLECWGIPESMRTAEDVAYDIAVEHCLAAVLELLSKPT